jgi:hypothetical protein
MTERFAAVSRSNTFFYRLSRRPLLYPPSNNEHMLDGGIECRHHPLSLFLCWKHRNGKYPFPRNGISSVVQYERVDPTIGQVVRRGFNPRWLHVTFIVKWMALKKYIFPNVFGPPLLIIIPLLSILVYHLHLRCVSSNQAAHYHILDL